MQVIMESLVVTTWIRAQVKRYTLLIYDEEINARLAILVRDANSILMQYYSFSSKNEINTSKQNEGDSSDRVRVKLKPHLTNLSSYCILNIRSHTMYWNIKVTTGFKQTMLTYCLAKNNIYVTSHAPHITKPAVDGNEVIALWLFVDSAILK